MDNNIFPDLQSVARALGGEVSGGQVLAPGPGHSAIDRSLSVKSDPDAPDGFVCHSFANDNPIACRDYIREKLNLPAFKPNGGTNRASNDDDIITKAVMAAARAQKPSKHKVVATYDYTNPDGGLLYQVVRYEPKDFRQRRPDGNGGWIWKLTEQRILYRWPELIKFRDATVYIAEGEKDADRIAGLNLCATTVAAGVWTKDCVHALAGRDVVILQDNDDSGRAKSLEAAQALHGVAKTIRIVALPDLPDKGDVSDWLDADPKRADKFCDVCFDTPPWQPEIGDTKTDSNTETRTEQQNETEPPQQPQPLLPFVKISDWRDRLVPERPWIVRDRIPAGHVTLLSGEGSVGKSILSLQLAVAIALGKDWLQSLPEHGPALVVCCEDDADEVWRRLDLIFSHYGATYNDFDDLHIAPLAGGETLMAVPNRSGIITVTKLFERVCEAACDIRPKLIVLDNAADIYGGNENDRAQVRQFIGHLRSALAIPTGAGVLLTSHPSLVGINSGTGLSGSTAWNASVRSRLYFKRATTEKDEEPDPDLRVLEVMKSNYGPAGETITLRWDKGLFLPVAGVGSVERAAAERATEDLFLNLLDEFSRRGDNTCAKSSARNFAPTLFAKERQAKQAHIRKADFEGAMRRLLEAGKIGLEPYGSPSRDRTKLVRR